jgi:anti-sigma factor RsiW
MIDHLDCAAAVPLVAAYIDGELDVASCAALERHAAGCPHCRGAISRAHATHVAIRDRADRWIPPDDLAASIRVRLGAHGAAHPTDGRAPEGSPPRVFVTRWRSLLPFAAGATFAACATLLVTTLAVPRVGSGDILGRELAAGHARSLLTGRMQDVASSDHHRVKPWLDARLDYAVPVPDLSTIGFSLEGGRLDYLDRRPVAALVYKRRDHVVNLFVFPSDPATTPSERTEQGYRLIGWRSSGFDHWAVSDLNLRELREFAAAAAASTQ